MFDPLIVHASTHEEKARNFVALVNENILFPIINLMLGVALLIFLYGVFEFILGANNEEARSTGRKHILWGVIGMLIMVSALAILQIAAGTFGLGGVLDSLVI